MKILKLFCHKLILFYLLDIIGDVYHISSSHTTSYPLQDKFYILVFFVIWIASPCSCTNWHLFISKNCSIKSRISFIKLSINIFLYVLIQRVENFIYIFVCWCINTYHNWFLIVICCFFIILALEFKIIAWSLIIWIFSSSINYNWLIVL